MEKSNPEDQIEREAIGLEFSTSMNSRNIWNNRRGGVRINQNSIMKTIEDNDLKGLDIKPPEVGEIVTDSESDEE